MVILDPVKIDDFESSWIFSKIEEDKASHKKIWLNFGLSANPVHLGHLTYLSEIADKIEADIVSLIPSKHNPFKQGISQGTVEQKKEMMKAALVTYKCLSHSDAETFVDEQELNRQTPYSFTWETVQNISKKALEKNATIYLLLTDESAKDFYCWKEPLYIVRHATLIYGKRPGAHFDQAMLVDELRKIDMVARKLGIQEIATSDELSKMVEEGIIQDVEIEVEGMNGEKIKKIIAARKIRCIHPEVVEAIERGYVPLTGKINVSSSEIRLNIQSGVDVTHQVGEKIAAVIQKHGLYLRR